MSQCSLIDIESSHPQIATQYDADSGNAIPLANVLTINGMTVANGLFATPIFTTGSGNTITINQQVGTAITGAPANKNDAGIVSFDDTIFSVTEHGYVSLLGGGLAIDSFLTDVAGPTQPTGAGEVTVTGTSIFSDGSVANTLTLNVQATANTFLLGAGTDTNATELGPLTNGQLIIGNSSNPPTLGNITSTDGSVTITNGAGTIDLAVAASDDAVLTLTGDAGGQVSPTLGDIDIQGVTVANAANAKPLFIQGTPGSSLIEADIQVSAAITGAPADKNNSGICSFDDTEFTVDVNGFVQLAGTGAGQTITGDDSVVLSPTAGNWNILGLGESSTSGSGSTLSILSPRVSKFIVDPTLNNGTYQTITAAVAAASSGETVFIRPGTYVENFTLPENIHLQAFGGNDPASQVTIQGKISYTASGRASITGIRLLTNGDYFLELSGASAGVVTLNKCFLQVEDFIGISHTTSNINSRIQINGCEGIISGVGISLFTSTSAGRIELHSTYIENGAQTSTPSTCSAGEVAYENCKIIFPTVTTGTGVVQVNNCVLQSTPSTPFVLLTHGGSPTNSFVSNSRLSSGTSSSISTSSTFRVSTCTIDSTNTNPITGSGTIVYSGVSFIGTGSINNAVAKTGRSFHAGSISFDGGTNSISAYEEGTFSPTIAGSSTAGTPTYVRQLGKYKRINDLVFITVNLSWSTLSGAAGNLQLGGLPFTSENTTGRISALTAQFGTDTHTLAITSGRVPVMYITPNSTLSTFLEFVQTSGANSVITVKNSGSLSLSGFYYAA